VENYSPLTLAECFDVEEAVTTGQRVPDPALRPAARGLALHLLNGRLRYRNTGSLAAAALLTISGAMAVATGSGVFLKIIAGAGCLILVALSLRAYVKGPSRALVQQALRLNE
jgi:hypothetical protein